MCLIYSNLNVLYNKVCGYIIERYLYEGYLHLHAPLTTGLFTTDTCIYITVKQLYIKGAGY